MLLHCVTITVTIAYIDSFHLPLHSFNHSIAITVTIAFIESLLLLLHSLNHSIAVTLHYYYCYCYYYITDRQYSIALLPIFSHGLTTATGSSWVHLILSSHLSRKFRTLLQVFFSWHPVTTTQHLSWKNCTSFPFQNVLSINSLVYVSVL